MTPPPLSLSFPSHTTNSPLPCNKALSPCRAPAFRAGTPSPFMQGTPLFHARHPRSSMKDSSPPPPPSMHDSPILLHSEITSFYYMWLDILNVVDKNICGNNKFRSTYFNSEKSCLQINKNNQTTSIYKQINLFLLLAKVINSSSLNSTNLKPVNSNKTGTLRRREILKPIWRKLKLVL